MLHSIYHPLHKGSVCDPAHSAFYVNARFMYYTCVCSVIWYIAWYTANRYYICEYTIHQLYYIH